MDSKHCRGNYSVQPFFGLLLTTQGGGSCDAVGTGRRHLKSGQCSLEKHSETVPDSTGANGPPGVKETNKADFGHAGFVVLYLKTLE